MKASDYIIDFFASKGVDTIFGYIGGMIVHLVDSADKNDKVRFIQTYHEQTAAIAAEGYSLEKGTIGVAMATSGPGFTNMLTGIADAYFGSVPVIYISGQVNSYEYKYGKPIRQQGFQETDAVSVATPITKYAKMVDNADDLVYELEKAYYIANEGRTGPVLLDIPMNIQRADINPAKMRHFVTPVHGKKGKEYDLNVIKKMLYEAKCPMILVGSGCMSSEARKELKVLLDNTQIPAVTSLMGKGCIDESYKYYMGMVGSYGNRCANIAMSKVDVLLVLGSRLDLRQTGNYKLFLPDSKIIHVNNDGNELKYNRIENRYKLNMDVLDFICEMNTKDINIGKIAEWHEDVSKIKAEYSQEEEVYNYVENKSPYQFLMKLNEVADNDCIYTSDIGQNQMWTAQTLHLKEGQHYYTSGNLAPMGFSLPAAVGAAFASPDKTIYCINGDGGFHMAVQTLLLISQYHLKIKVIVINNESLGMITQFQRQYFDGRLVATSAAGGYLEPDMKPLAEAYRLPYYRINMNNLNELSIIGKEENCIIDFYTNGLTTVSPKLPFDHALDDMLPTIKY